MRFFIRNKTKYNPEDAFQSAIIAVDVDHTQEIGKIKEVYAEVLLLLSLWRSFMFVIYLCCSTTGGQKGC